MNEKIKKLFDEEFSEINCTNDYPCEIKDIKERNDSIKAFINEHFVERLERDDPAVKWNKTYTKQQVLEIAEKLDYYWQREHQNETLIRLNDLRYKLK